MGRAGGTEAGGTVTTGGGGGSTRKRAGLTLVDQSFSSLSNFAVGVAVTRVAGAAGLGAFSFAYAGWQVLAAMHRSLVTDPMAIEGDVYNVEGDVTTEAVRRSIKDGLAAELLLGLAGAVFFALMALILLACGQRAFGMGVGAMAPWLPVLLAQDYWRWVGFMTRRPQCALANDTVFNVIQGAAFAAVLLTHTRSIVVLIGSWGLGSLAGALYGLRQHRVLPSLSGGMAMLRDHWSVSKWLAGTSLSVSGGTQLTVFIVGAVLGPVGLGGLRAAQTLVVGPSGVLIMAGGSIGLPEATKGYTERGWKGLNTVARWVTFAGFCSFLAGAIAIVLFGRTLLSSIYGASFAHLELAAVLMAIAYVVLSFNLGPILVLKATRHTRALFRIQLLSLVASLASLAAFSLTWGVDGAAAATIVTYAVSSGSSHWVQRRVRRTVGEAPARVGPLLEEELWWRSPVPEPAFGSELGQSSLR
ncbi:MAG TPA: hypothetical protein VMB72_02385 [Acidimicrobiales bacterium]|nr:hypothetical protein [Acidimicrobiales bacterium]